MAKDSKYVIVASEDFDTYKETYIAEGFTNRGTVRYNLNQTEVLLEEDPSWLTRAEQDNVTIIWQGNEDEARQYLIDNKVDWEEPEEEMI